MRRIAWIAVLLSACGALWGQEITEENFLKEESALAARFEAQSEAFSGQFAAAQSQTERDSLTVAYNALFQQYLHAMEALSVQYAATPSGL